MATTTTIRLSEELKERIASAAQRAGKSSHSFILEAIVEKADLEEQHASFDAEANARFAKIVESGETIPWSDMRQYLEQRLAGGQMRRPVVKKR